MTEVATIAAEVDKRRVLCRISYEVLKKKFQASSEEPMQIVADNRPVLHAAAKRLIQRQAYEEDGSVLVRERDI